MLLELLILTLVLGAVLLSLCYGKKNLVEQPIIEYIPEHYHLTLSPRLPPNFARQLCQLPTLPACNAGDIPCQYYAVAEHNKNYLLALSLRDNTYYCQAIEKTDTEDYLAIKQYAEAVLIHHPLKHVNPAGIEQLTNAIETFAEHSGVTITQILPPC